MRGEVCGSDARRGGRRPGLGRRVLRAVRDGPRRCGNRGGGAAGEGGAERPTRTNQRSLSWQRRVWGKNRISVVCVGPRTQRRCRGRWGLHRRLLMSGEMLGEGNGGVSVHGPAAPRHLSLSPPRSLAPVQARARSPGAGPDHTTPRRAPLPRPRARVRADPPKTTHSSAPAAAAALPSSSSPPARLGACVVMRAPAPAPLPRSP